MEKQTNKKGIIAIIVSAAILITAVIVLMIYPRDKKEIDKEIKKENEVQVDSDMAAVYQIELTVVSPSDNNINYVRYPYYYMAFSENNDLIQLELDSKTRKYAKKSHD